MAVRSLHIQDISNLSQCCGAGGLRPPRERAGSVQHFRCQGAPGRGSRTLRDELLEPGDVGADSQVRAPFTEQPTVYLYDMVPGGVGLAEKLFEVRNQLIDACLALVKACTCENGCPGCVGPQVEPNSPARKAATLMLERLIA